MVNLTRAYQQYPYKISRRTKFFNVLRFCARVPVIEEWIANRIINGSDFWKRSIPPIYLYERDTIRRGVRNGIRMDLDLSNLVDHSVFFGVPAQTGWANLLKLVKPDAVVFDIGANIGFLTLSFAQICKLGWVHSFEPGKNNFKRLQQNIQLNNFLNITSHPIAIGEQAGIKQLAEVYPFNTGANRILESIPQNIQSENVPVDSLDHVTDALQIKRLDILKIDVEGYELFVLRGGRKTIQRFRPVLFVELADDNLVYHGLSARDILNFVQDLNYSVVDARTLQSLDEPPGKVHLDIICFPKTV